MQVQIRKNISLKRHNTFGIEARAKYFARFTSVEEVWELLKNAALEKENQKLILGGGSNVLFTKNVNGVVLKNEIDGIEIIKEDAEHIYIQVGAGVGWHSFVLFCIDHNYGGVENLALIQGSVGASPMQNIGAYGVELKDVFHSLEAVHIQDKEVHVFSKSDCKFGYRESIFKHVYKGQYIITSVTFRLNKIPTFNTSYGAINTELERLKIIDLNINAIAQAVINIRTSKLPDWKKLGNAGSFFKNPQVSSEQFENLKMAFPGIVGFPQNEGVKLAAGWLIEQCGWKGFRKGDVGCYEKQALVLVNYGAAKGSDIYALSEQIIDTVFKKFGVQLEREVNVM